MSFLPIAERELRVAAKRRATFRARTIFALLASLIAAVFLFAGLIQGSRQMGGSLFPALSTLAFLYCLIAGGRTAADALSEEKREGTLGLLFLTDLDGADVVAGKLVGCSIRTFQGLLAFFPVLAMSLVLGGVTGGEFWRTALMLACTLGYALAVGLGVSACSRTGAVALTVTFGILTATTMLPLLANPVLTWIGFSSSWFVTLSPASALRLGTDLAYQANRRQYWMALTQMTLVAAGFLTLATIVLPRSWQERRKGPRQRASSSPADLQRRAESRTWMLDVNPFFWLAARNQEPRILLWLLVGVAALVELPVLTVSPRLGGFQFGVPTVVNFVLAAVVKLILAWRSCATLAEARETGAVELVLATPLPVEKIIRGHWQALRCSFLWPVAAVLVLRALPQIQMLLQEPLYQGNVSRMVWLPLPGLLLFSLGTFVLDLIAIAWVGMWMGLTRPKPVDAFARTVLCVVLLPTLAFCLPNALFDLFWIVWARRKLEHEFRKAASDRYSTVGAGSWLQSPASSGHSLPPLLR